MKFTCIDCEFHFCPEIDGDAEERMCYECLENHYKERETDES